MKEKKSMNQRIKELAKQAGQGEPFHIPSEFVERFAELLVQECADIFGREGTGEYQVDGNWIAKTIKQHFGVKE
jgi:hypothetical protein